jgi:hypothetical protein
MIRFAFTFLSSTCRLALNPLRRRMAPITPASLISAKKPSIISYQSALAIRPRCFGFTRMRTG